MYGELNIDSIEKQIDQVTLHSLIPPTTQLNHD